MFVTYSMIVTNINNGAKLNSHILIAREIRSGVGLGEVRQSGLRGGVNRNY